MKISLVLLQVILVALLYFLNKNSYFIGGIAATVLALILHLVEFRRSPIAIESLLTYWSANTAFTFAVFIQDSYSKHKIYANSGPAYVIEIISLVNSFLIFVFEVGYYKPGFEITNEKFLDTVNLFSYFTFYYLQPLINKIYATDDVQLTDLPDILGNITCDDTKAKVAKAWEEELKRTKKPGLVSKVWSFVTRRKVNSKPQMFLAIAKAF